MEAKEEKANQELLKKLKPLPGQLVVIERGTFIGLRGAISRDFGMANDNTVTYYVDGVCLGTDIEDRPTIENADKLIATLAHAEHPVRAVSVDGHEDIEIPKEEFLADINVFLERKRKEN